MQDPCLTVCTILPNPPEEVVNHNAYLIDMSLKTSACGGSDRNYNSKRDHTCLWDREDRLERELEGEMEKVEVWPVYAARLTKVFNTTFKSSSMKPIKEKVKEILLNGQSPEYKAFMRRVTGVEFYRKLGPMNGDLSYLLIVGQF